MLRDRLTDMLASRYLVGEELPGGAMARVFAGRDPVLDRPVVIKVLPPERATAVAVERFRREARLLAKLNHPHVVPVLESGESEGMCWFVMPHVSGAPLSARLAGGALDPETVRRFGLELLDALEHAHAIGVVHRDIKPANVLLNAGHALLADFGVALLRDSSDDALTDAGVAVGTLSYMPPEQRAGRVDRRSDVWALGATLYEAATGTRWDATSGGDRWRAVPAQLRAPLRRALADDPDDRWADAASFRDGLTRAARLQPRAATMAWVTGVAMLAFILLVLAADRTPRTAWAASDSVDVIVTASPEAPKPLREVTRQAGLMLQWLPMLRTVPPDGLHEVARARVRVQLWERVRGTDTTIAVVAHDDAGNLLGEDEVARDPSDPAGVGRRIARHVVATRFPMRLVEFDQLGRSSGDAQAWRELWMGLTAFQEGRHADAEAALGAALRRDSTFAVASWVRLLARMWQREEFDEDLARLANLAQALPPPIDALVHAQREPDLRRRLATFDSVARAHPWYGPARLLYANELFHRGALVGHSLREGVTAFAAAAAEVPDLDHVNTQEQVLWGATRLGDRDLAASAARRLGTHPDRVRREVLLLAFDARFQPTAATVRRALLPILVRGERVAEVARYLRLGLHFDLPAEQRRMADLVASRSEDPALRRSALGARATALLMEGRPAAALAALDAAGIGSGPEAEGFRLQAAEWRLLLPLFGVAGGAARPAPRDSSQFRDAGGSRFAFASAIAALEAGDHQAADRWTATLRSRSGGDSVAADLLALLSAHAAAARGSTATALVLSASLERDVGDARALARGPLARAVTKWRRGAWRLAEADSTGAEAEWRWSENNDLQGWPVGAPQEGELDAALSPVARLARARMRCASGDLPEGRALLAQVDRLWARAEPAVRNLPLRTAAREACR